MVVLYRFSTSNHNYIPSFVPIAALYYIVSLHQTTTHDDFGRRQHSCIISFLYIKPRHGKEYALTEFSCITSFLYIKPQRLTSSMPSFKSCIISFLYIKPQQKRVLNCCENVVLYRFSTSNHNSFKVITSCAFFNDRVAGEVKTRLLLSMVLFLLYLAKDVKLKVDALNKCLKLRVPKSYARSKLFVFHIRTFLGFYIFGLPGFLIVS